MNDSEAYRDSVLKIIVVLATAFIGWVTTTPYTDLWEDTHIIIWIVLFTACGFILWSIGARRKRKEAEAASEKRQKERNEQRKIEYNKINNRLDNQEKKLNVFGNIMQAMSRKDIIDMAERIIDRGWTTSEERKAFYDLYDTYKSLGIDGYIRSYVDKVNNIPVKDMDKVINRIGGTK